MFPGMQTAASDTWDGRRRRGFAAAGALALSVTALAAPQPPANPTAWSPGPLLRRCLAGPLAATPEIVFAVRVPGRDHWYVSFGNYADHSDTVRDRARAFADNVYWGYGEGGRLCRLNLRTGALKVLLDDPRGGVRDPQVHYDGRRLLCAYRPGGSHTYHLYEINSDGTGLRQLTDGPDDDIEPAYCPDGGIVFGSSRCRRYVNCWYSRVATLHRCNADGTGVRMLSSNNDHDNTPWLLPDGRVLYMRWEYVDRSQLHYHHLWTMNPDGTGQTVYYGNANPGISMLDAKPIPGTRRVVAAFSPGHGQAEHTGHVTVVDPAEGPDALSRARTLSRKPEWRDPYPLDTEWFLVAHREGLFLLNASGETERLFALPAEERAGLMCAEPRPLAPRPRETCIPSRTRLAATTGTVVLEDIYAGRRMAGVARGSIARLLVLKQLPKPVNFSGGMEPLTIGGSFTLAEILGTVPVAADGSACLELPALQSVFFVALDHDNRPVKRMHSFLTVQPGETTGCVGCHEPRTAAPHAPAAKLLAPRRPPTPVEPLAGIPAVIDFPRDIQPILDRHCAGCHNPRDYKGRVSLAGDHTPRYTVSYTTLIGRGQVNDARNRVTGNDAPYTYGSAVSPLMAKLDGAHHNVHVAPRERDLVRLWIETSACYPGTYAALGHPPAMPALPLRELNERCGACHLRQPAAGAPAKEQPQLVFARAAGSRLESVCNLTRPACSPLLLAPLARAAGGLDLCGQAVFKDTRDPLYAKLLAALQSAQGQLQEVKRFDMPDFRPNPHYIREMQRFGFIPPTLGPQAPVDVYKVDRAYWDSFAWRSR